MSPLNYNHLYYFYMVAKLGTVTEASKQLHLKPQTISGQINKLEEVTGTQLFQLKGKKLELTATGKVVFDYACKIFALGEDLKNVFKQDAEIYQKTLTVGITEVIPKTLAQLLLSPIMDLDDPFKLICREGEQSALLAELSVNNIDLVITEQPLQSGLHIRAYNHQVATSNISFFANHDIDAFKGDFPGSLNGAPFLLQGKNASIRQALQYWFDLHGIQPNIIAEFDDMALLKAFALNRKAVFAAPSIIERHIASQYGFSIVGRAEEIKEQYFVISHERHVRHPAVAKIIAFATDRTSA